ncbi:MAG: Spy/CpxP family protein refolding chaperone [Deltaproteobacteria bacterium]|nr:Spy/CpxP family protein refolding chaperone [Deltaproteobacteria bacterium]
MKKSMKNFALVAITLAIFGVGFHHAYAALSDESSLTSMNPFLKRGYAGLGISDIQMNAIKAVVKKNLPELQTMTNQIISERRVLKSLIRAQSVNEDAIRAQVRKLAEMEADMCVKRAVIGQEIRTILTPEQLQKSAEMSRFRERMMDRRIARIFKWYEE